jgi:hypothetical protein
LRLQGRLTAWVETVDYKSLARTTSTLIFACIDCNIENSTWTIFPDLIASDPYKGISAVKCTVDVTLQQATMNVGISGPSNDGVNVSAIVTVDGPLHHSSPYGHQGDVAEWLGTVITTYGDSVYGAQPLWGAQSMFASASQLANQLPVVVTTTQYGITPDNWTQDALEHFVSVGSGALALAMSRQWNNFSMVLNSTLYEQQILPSRALLLLIPPFLVLGANAVLAALLAYLYSRASIPYLRQARTSEMISSTQNETIAAGVRKLHNSSEGSQELESLMVQYGVVEEGSSHLGLRCVNKDCEYVND